MPAPTPDPVELDQLATEAVAENGRHLDELSVAELVELMNERDATIPGAVRTALPVIAAAIDGAVRRMRAGGRLIYVGAGTSGRLGVLDASEVPPTFGVRDVVVGVIAGGPDALVSSVEAAEDREDTGARDVAALEVGPDDTVVGVASSGRTPYVIGAVREAARRGALTVGLSCNLGAPLSAAVDHGIEIPVGPEVVSGSTRLGAGTATKMVLNMFSTITMVGLGKTYGSLMVDVLATNAKLVRRALRIVTTATGVDEATAREALDRSGWHAKVAIAMLVSGLDADEARRRLDAAGGILRTVIESGRGA